MDGSIITPIRWAFTSCHLIYAEMDRLGVVQVAIVMSGVPDVTDSPTSNGQSMQDTSDGSIRYVAGSERHSRAAAIE